MTTRLPVGPDTPTPRQLEVGRLVARGLTNPQIGTELSISLDGAKYHVGELLRRLSLSTRQEVAEHMKQMAEENTMTTPSENVKSAVPFFGVSNMAESLKFYVDGLGFEMTQSWTEEGKYKWVWIKIGGAALMLQEDAPEAGVKVGDVTVYFICEDALAIYHDIKARGVEGKKPFISNGMWAIYLSGPDGHQICFQSPTDADLPEETEYSEAVHRR